jgi:hypothetical protein
MRERAKILTDAQDGAIRQHTHIHIAWACIRPLRIGLNDATASVTARGKIGGQPFKNQIGIAASRRHRKGKFHVWDPPNWRMGGNLTSDRACRLTATAGRTLSPSERASVSMDPESTVSMTRTQLQPRSSQPQSDDAVAAYIVIAPPLG